MLLSKSLKKKLSGWYRTILYAAPKGVEQVRTVYSNEVSHLGTKDVTAEYQKFVQESHELLDEYRLPKDGVGSVYYRNYRICFTSDKEPNDLISRVGIEPNRFSNPTLAEFNKTRGNVGRLTKGDRFMISITGPWNGPVEVVDISNSSFTFITLQDHLESGFIRFGFNKKSDKEVEFSIDSWAKSSNRVVWLSYEVLGASMKMQTKMWRYFSLSVAKNFGPITSPLYITTIKCDRP